MTLALYKLGKMSKSIFPPVSQRIPGPARKSFKLSFQFGRKSLDIRSLRLNPPAQTKPTFSPVVLRNPRMPLVFYKLSELLKRPFPNLVRCAEIPRSANVPSLGRQFL